jgi:hypothetical protein
LINYRSSNIKINFFMLNVDPLYYYKIYGLKIATTRPLPPLALISSPSNVVDQVDVFVDLVGTPEPETALLDQSFWRVSQEAYQQQGFYLWVTATPEGTYSRLRSQDGSGTVDFVINPSGNQVWGFWSSPELFQDTVSMLLGAVLGHLLRLRGVLCLHASVVAIAGGAIAIIGASGTGKSTTAAALAARGLAVLSDDIAALDWQENLAAGQLRDRVWVQPGYPSLRLWEPSLRALQIPDIGLKRVGSRLNKCFLQLGSASTQTLKEDEFEHNGAAPQRQFGSEPLRLQAIYVLNPPDTASMAARIQPLDVRIALYHLLSHVYGREMLTVSQRQEELRQLTRLLKAVPVKLLHRPNNLEYLNQICALMISDFERVQIPSL